MIREQEVAIDLRAWANNFRGVSIQQPWAEKIISGEKLVENRTWATNHCGPVIIHAAKKSDYISAANLLNYQTGVIIGFARIENCLTLPSLKRKAAVLSGNSSYKKALESGFADGPYCWMLSSVYRLETPIEHKGTLGLWKPKADLIDRLMPEIVKWTPNGAHLIVL